MLRKSKQFLQALKEVDFWDLTGLPVCLVRDHDLTDRTSTKYVKPSGIQSGGIK